MGVLWKIMTARYLEFTIQRHHRDEDSIECLYVHIILLLRFIELSIQNDRNCQKVRNCKCSFIFILSKPIKPTLRTATWHYTTFRGNHGRTNPLYIRLISIHLFCICVCSDVSFYQGAVWPWLSPCTVINIISLIYFWYQILYFRNSDAIANKYILRMCAFSTYLFSFMIRSGRQLS